MAEWVETSEVKPLKLRVTVLEADMIDFGKTLLKKHLDQELFEKSLQLVGSHCHKQDNPKISILKLPGKKIVFELTLCAHVVDCAVPVSVANATPPETGFVSWINNNVLSSPSLHASVEAFKFMAAEYASIDPPVNDGNAVLRALMEHLPGLNQVMKKCPADDPCIASRSFVKKISNLVMHVNDYHKWTREEIADWLESLDVDLTFQTALD